MSYETQTERKSKRKPDDFSFVRLYNQIRKWSERRYEWLMCFFRYCSRNIIYIFLAIYYNPSPPCYKKKTPKVLDELKNPVIRSITNMYGTASGMTLFEIFLAPYEVHEGVVYCFCFPVCNKFRPGSKVRGHLIITSTFL